MSQLKVEFNGVLTEVGHINRTYKHVIHVICSTLHLITPKNAVLPPLAVPHKRLSLSNTKKSLDSTRVINQYNTYI